MPSLQAPASGAAQYAAINEANSASYVKSSAAGASLSQKASDMQEENALLQQRLTLQQYINLGAIGRAKLAQEEIDKLERINILKQLGVDATDEELKRHKEVLDRLQQEQKAAEEIKRATMFQSRVEQISQNTALSRAVSTGDAERKRVLMADQYLKSIGYTPDVNDPKYYDKFMELVWMQREQDRQAVWASLKQRSNGLLQQAVGAVSPTRATYMSIREAATAGGMGWTKSQDAAAMKLAELTTRLSALQSMNTRDDVIHTNELASKGGFSSSVVVEKNDTQNRMVKIQASIAKTVNEIAIYNKKVTEILG